MEGKPPLTFTCAKVPVIAPFLVITFKIPPFPSGSYFAEGAVINSTLSKAFAGNCAKIALASPCVGFPFIKIVKPLLPLTLISPRPSIVKEGKFLTISIAFPPTVL